MRGRTVSSSMTRGLGLSSGGVAVVVAGCSLFGDLGALQGSSGADAGCASDEVCNGSDDDCDGQVDEGCACEAGTTQECYTGPAATKNVGVCKPGEQSCSSDTWGGACAGEVLPTVEVCNGKDDDCNGSVDEKLQTSAYFDADGDGFGAGSNVVVCIGEPGYVDNADDCYDQNKDAFPGQPQYFQTDRGDGSFDYDCDGVVTENVTVGPTTEIGDWGLGSTNAASWLPLNKTYVFAVRYLPAGKRRLAAFRGALQRYADATGTLRVAVCADAAGVPGAELETSTGSVDIATFNTWTSAPTAWSVPFAGTYLLEEGVVYWLVAHIENSNFGEASDNIVIPLVATGPGYDAKFLVPKAAGGIVGTAPDGVVWGKFYPFPWFIDGSVVTGLGEFH